MLDVPGAMCAGTLCFVLQLFSRFEDVITGEKLGRARSNPDWKGVCPSVEAQVRVVVL